MPRLMPKDSEQIIAIPGPGNFQFSAVRIEDLGSTKYTLATIVVDRSGSVATFADALLKCIKSIVESLQDNAFAENILVRLLLFNQELEEVHGFKELTNIDVNDYKDIVCDGFTSLYDASYDGIGATLTYSEELINQDFDCNGVVYIITDGVNNRGTMTPSSIATQMAEARQQEKIMDLQAYLITLRSPGSSWEKMVDQKLEEFFNDANLTKKIDVGEATPKALSKLAGFVSESVSSQSQAIMTGQPSQSLSF